MILFTGFAVVALLLASVGIYGVLSYVVGQRTQEIGIRMALGAQRGDVLRVFLRDGARMTLIGVAAGGIAALALTRLMASILFEVKPTDPVTFGGVAVLLCAIALLASYIPARRAASVEPMQALRSE
jgi:ABC-type antimicrobial peptide transport system permease subunit